MTNPNLHETPPPKIPDHLDKADVKSPSREEKIDRQMKDSFPASDPPSFSGGNHTVGAPTGRESDAPDPHAVEQAEKKVKTGDAAVPHTY